MYVKLNRLNMHTLVDSPTLVPYASAMFTRFRLGRKRRLGSTQLKSKAVNANNVDYPVFVYMYPTYTKTVDKRVTMKLRLCMLN